MSALATPSTQLPAPPFPLPPELRADVAYRCSQGASWEEIGSAVRFDPDALRRAAYADAHFVAELAAAWDEVMREAEAIAVRRLRRLVESESPKVALRAAEVLVMCVRSYRRAAKPAAPRGPAVEARPIDRMTPRKPEPPRAVVMG